MEIKESNINITSCLPSEIALKIGSSLSDEDVCRLGSCNRYWREICGSDPIWISLSKNRWPSLFTHPSPTLDSNPPMKDWKSFYAKMHKDIGATLTSVMSFVNQCISESNSVDPWGYHKVYEELASVKFDSNDVELFLFNTDISVIFNLLGLHYSIKFLKVHPEAVVEALRKHKVHERKVAIEWTKLVRRNFQCTLESEKLCGSFTLEDLAMANCYVDERGEEEVPKEFEVVKMLELDYKYAFFVGGKVFASSPT